MSGARKALEDAVRACEIHSLSSFSWIGERQENLRTPSSLRFDAALARKYLLHRLEAHLYMNFYCTGRPAKIAPPPTLDPRQDPWSFAEALSRANRGRGSWENGWILQQRQGDRGMRLRKHGLDVWARTDDWRARPDDADGSRDPKAALRLPKEFLNRLPGFYLALSDAPWPPDPGEPTLRLYWNLPAQGAVPFMTAATSRLNAAGIVFRLKIVNDPTRFGRCDAAILYLRKSDCPAALRVVERLYARIAPHLRELTPSLTKHLAPGLGLAEDPGGGESFGMHRCRLLAQGLLRGFERKASSTGERLAVVAAQFHERGLDPELPFLNPRSRDEYALRPKARSRPALRASRGLADSFLGAAREIGTRLIRDAVWHRGQCTWITAQPRAGRPLAGWTEQTLQPLGYDLYSGSSGVGLFLAALYSITRDRAARDAACGALRHAVARVGEPLAQKRLGLFDGWPGVALAAGWAGSMIGEDSLLDVARGLWRRHGAAAAGGKTRDDLLSGRAGAIAAALALHGLLGERRLVRWAARLGDQLLRRAERDEHGLSWADPDIERHRNLTGLSHGTAGIGCALLELSRATGDARYARAADEAFGYERRWFDARAGNWPDFRRFPGRRGRSSPATFWCHGAPGIALSRLRALEIRGAETDRAEATAALRATMSAVLSSLDAGPHDFSLCHGLAGNADVLLHGSRTLSDNSQVYRAAALRVAETGLDRFAGGKAPWPCGIEAAEVPGLMLGKAGIGYFYLRLRDPGLASPLLLKPEDFAKAAQRRH